MSFYTNVQQHGNHILFRGYDSKGNAIQKKHKLKPKFYLSTAAQNTDWVGLDGTPVKEIVLDSISDARSFIDKYADIGNMSVFGNSNFIAQFLAEAYPDNIEYNFSHIRIGNVDIEVASDDGFPEPEQAEHEVISIAYKDSRNNIYWVWGLGPYDVSKSTLRLNGALIRYVQCDTEAELLQKFVIFWENHCPDVITGWNIHFFDIPYLVNRIRKVCGEKTVKAMSPWGIVKNKDLYITGQKQVAYDILGVSQLDYLELFKKFGYTYGTQESYSLDHIAHVILGEKKLSYEEYGSLHTLYKSDFQTFIDYNIRDVQLVDMIDKETGLLSLALVIAYKGGVNYIDTLGTTAIWDSIVYRYLNLKKVAIPEKKKKIKTEYPGGYVKDPQRGKGAWRVSFDLNSLYPNLIVQYNMSPETLIKGLHAKSGVDHYLSHPVDSEFVDRNVSVAANGSCYRKDKVGVLPEIIVGLYDERKATKKKMLAVQQENEKTPSEELKREVNRLGNMQMAIKILLNSLYGALGNAHFRHFELEMAEGITLSGQLSIRWAENAVNKEMNRILKTIDKDYVIAIDTDSIYVDMSSLVSEVNPRNPVEYLDKVCSQHFEPLLERAYADLFTHMNAFENRMVMAREVIADSGIWVAKKRYILNVHNNEGVQYSEPKLKTMGLEAVKSSTPQIIRDKFKKAYKIMLTGNEEELQEFVSNFYEEFKTLPPEDVSFPRGVSDVEKWIDPISGYKTGTPIHVRGAILFNQQLKEHGLDKHTELIKNGTKVKFCYLKMPNPIRENVIAFPQYLPKEFDLLPYIDYETQFDKAFIEPLKLVSDTIDWSLIKINTLEDFFS